MGMRETGLNSSLNMLAVRTEYSRDASSEESVTTGFKSVEFGKDKWR